MLKIQVSREGSLCFCVRSAQWKESSSWVLLLSSHRRDAFEVVHISSVGIVQCTLWNVFVIVLV